MRLLLLSNSTLPGQPYLGWPKEHIIDFLKDLNGPVVFVPYAGVTISFDAYSELTIKAFEAMGLEMIPIHTQPNKKTAIEQAGAIAVGGGNTFHLLKHLQDEDLIEPIRGAVSNGVPYIGWSAGSNVASPLINTTNDMPIVQPDSFEALGLIDLQINPHYTEKTIEGHGGESRDQRLAEFIAIHKNRTVIGLPEGSLLRVEDKIELVGAEAKLIRYGHDPLVVPEGFLEF